MPIDWARISLPLLKAKTRIQAGQLHPLTHWKLVVLCKLLGLSQSVLLKMIVEEWIKSNWAEHEDKLLVDAHLSGKTPEAVFSELCVGDRESLEEDSQGMVFEVIRKLKAGEPITGAQIAIAASELCVPVDKLMDLVKSRKGGVVNGDNRSTIVD